MSATASPCRRWLGRSNGGSSAATGGPTATPPWPRPTPWPRGLGLSATDRLLDIGTGRDWPGLYLAARTGCRVILTDLPLEGLRVAANRATAEGLAAGAAMVVAAASGLPFRAGSFDAIIHTDVLC
jgi:2-polyprenyl-3-methyl-5-hydroxy-6-metoxy-1,4-benzoquinol methylase